MTIPEQQAHVPSSLRALVQPARRRIRAVPFLVIMAGVKGMHQRASRSPHYAESIRARIRAGGIAKLLEEHILGKRDMSKTQVAAALGLLRLVIPQQASVEHKGEISHYVAQLPEVEKTQEQWKQHYAPTAH